MWLLKFHLAFSFLCLITFLGFRHIGRDVIKKNGWVNENAEKSILAFWIFFVPLINILAVIIILVMIGMTKEDFDKIVEDANNK